MAIIDFDKFERFSDILESKAPVEFDGVLDESDMRDLEEMNESFLGDLFGGWFKKLKKNILRKIPGGVLKKVDSIIGDYEKERTDLMKKELKEKEKIFKAELEIEKGKDAKRNEQIMDRAKTAIKTIKKASDAKIDKINTQLEQLSKGKSDLVEDYINLKIAEVQEKLANSELEALEKFASEDRIKELEGEVEKRKQERESLQKDLEAATKKGDDLPGMKAKKGERWTRDSKKGNEVVVTVLEDPSEAKDGKVLVKGTKGQEYRVDISSLKKKNK
jgi:hypothetical protein